MNVWKVRVPAFKAAEKAWLCRSRSRAKDRARGVEPEHDHVAEDHVEEHLLGSPPGAVGAASRVDGWRACAPSRRGGSGGITGD